MGQRSHILLVEDLVIIQRAVENIMNKLNTKVTIAETGQEALNAMAQQSFDLVLMDIGLPDISGHEVTKRIRAESALNNTPIIALTANGNIEDHQAYLNAGMNEVMIKPITIDKADTMLAKYVDSSKIHIT